MTFTNNDQPYFWSKLATGVFIWVVILGAVIGGLVSLFNLFF